MFPDGACRICGKFDWQLKPQANQRTARGVHEKAHINRGEASFFTDAATGERMIQKTALGKQRFPDAPKPVDFSNIPHLQEGTAAGRVRALLHLMPPEFTIKNMMDKVGADVSQASVGGALRWAKESGIIKIARHIEVKEWRDQGKVGAPPLVYTYVGFENYSPPPPKTALKQKKANEESQMATQTVAIPGLDTSALAAVLEEPEHQCVATDAISNLQRTLGTLNLLLAVQNLPPEQLIALSGTINAIGQTTRRNRR